MLCHRLKYIILKLSELNFEMIFIDQTYFVNIFMIIWFSFSLLFTSDINAMDTFFRRMHNPPPEFNITSAPYLASVHIEICDNEQCMSSFLSACVIIHNYFVLTKSCWLGTSNIFVLAGTEFSSSINSNNNNIQKRYITCKRKMHNPRQATLLRLSEPFHFNTCFVQPIPILERWREDLEQCTILFSRWPTDESFPSKPHEKYPPSLTLRTDKVTIVHKECTVGGQKYIKAKFCECDQKPTMKDEGSPLVFVNGENKHYLIGIGISSSNFSSYDNLFFINVIEMKGGINKYIKKK